MLSLTVLFILALVLVLVEPYSQWLAVLQTLPVAGPRISTILEPWRWIRGDVQIIAENNTDFSCLFLEYPSLV